MKFKKIFKENSWIYFSIVSFIILILYSYYYLAFEKISTAIGLVAIVLLSCGLYRYSKSKNKWFAGEK